MTLSAQKTLDAINAALEYDQGAKFRGILRETMTQIEDAYSTKEEPFRAHLGASLIGRTCSRELWYSFRWFRKPTFDGRILRLFNRGHLEEARFVALFKLIGVTVHQLDQNKNQFRIKGYLGHAGGSLDAVLVNLPELGSTPALGEFKTSGDKQFVKLKEQGLVKAKFEHYIQMQLYMDYYNLEYGLYCAVNKNNDELHFEYIQQDKIQVERYKQRFQLIIDASVPPSRINPSPGWYECRFCDFHKICHTAEEEPERNCRTCQFSIPREDGEWYCMPADMYLTKEDQLIGCQDHTHIKSD